MTQTKPITLNEACRICYEELRDQGRYSIPGAVRLVKQRFPEAIAAEPDLLDGAIAERIRKMAKQSRPMTPYQRPLFMPEELANLKLTDSMSLPTPGLPVGLEESLAPPWSSFYWASFADLELHIALLDTGENYIRQKAQSFRRVRAFLLPILGNGRRDEPIGPVLEEIAAREREQRAA